jgi:DnaD/phage-associated family protein
VENGILATDDSSSCDSTDHTKVEPDVVPDQKKTAEKETAPPEDDKKQEQKTLPAIPVTKPSYVQILARAKESPEIGFLFNEAQIKLGRTIGYEAQCALLMMHDQYGLPVEVILMVLEYAFSVNKVAYSYIASIGRDWGEKEIDTIEKADAQITSLRTVNSLWKRFSSMAGLTNPRPTSAQVPYIRSWGMEMGFDAEMIYLGYEQMANHCQRLSLAYIDKVLKTWYNAGIKTPEDVEKANKTRGEQKANEKAKTNVDASYGLDDFKHSSLHDPIVYEKRKK